jgi:hypothetical protein
MFNINEITNVEITCIVIIACVDDTIALALIEIWCVELPQCWRGVACQKRSSRNIIKWNFKL